MDLFVRGCETHRKSPGHLHICLRLLSQLSKSRNYPIPYLYFHQLALAEVEYLRKFVAASG